MVIAPALLISLYNSRPAVAMHFEHPKLRYALDYPDSWTVDEDMLAVDGPLFLMSFSQSARQTGGLLPSGGMEIEVTVFPAGTDETLLLVPNQRAAKSAVKSVQTIGHRGVLRADYDLPFTDRNTYRATSMALRLDNKLFMILLMYEKDPPNADQQSLGEAALERVVSTLATVDAQ
jgi:hypothetical protein